MMMLIPGGNSKLLMGSRTVELCYICIVRSEYVRPGCCGSLSVRRHVNRDSAGVRFNTPFHGQIWRPPFELALPDA